MSKLLLALLVLTFSHSVFASTACDQIQTLRALIALESTAADANVTQLQALICAQAGTPKGSILYPNGNYAFVGPGYQDSGSWKYSNGNYAFVGPAYQDAGSWKYPNGNYAFVGAAYQDAGSWKYMGGSYAFVGPAYQDAGSWKYPNGNYAFVGAAYQDAGSWKYPNGNYAFVGPAYQDAGSWKYPNSDFAFVGPAYSNAGTWNYPNGSTYMTNSTADSQASMLTNIVSGFYNKPYTSMIPRNAPAPVKVMARLTWIQNTVK